VAASIVAVAGHFPAGRLTNQQLAQEYPDWSVDKIAEKTGIDSRPLAAAGETAVDLAVEAARRLFAGGSCAAADIDYVLLCTQSPDHFLPTSACIVQQRLGIPTSAGAIDFNLGCSGFVYGCGLAKGLIASGQARRVLLLTAETYSRYIDPADRSVRTLFGDAACATLIADSDHGGAIGALVYGSDGNGARNLMVEHGAARSPAGAPVLFMNGPEIFNFTLRTIPRCVGIEAGAVDHWLLHQANRYMLDHLRRKLGIAEERFPLRIADCGNTVSSTIPLLLEQELAAGRIRPGQRLALVGFGVGYSWGGALVDWR
jgi:3-oxoacyl-[acyl-carrier-protein] synthase-3